MRYILIYLWLAVILALVVASTSCSSYVTSSQKRADAQKTQKVPEFVTINGLKWATGNLVADGANGCKIGAPGDGGLYFQFGSLIGWKGGATGSGTGMPKVADGKWWGNAAVYSSKDISVTPAGYTSPTNVWPNFEVTSGKYGYYYYTNFTTQYADFQSQFNGKDAALGIGDPCTHYLGSPWRLPKHNELSAITGSAAEGSCVAWSTAGVTGKWVNNGPPSNATNGAWFGPNSRSGTPTTATDLFIPASGYRGGGSGRFYASGTHGYLWSSSVYNSNLGFDLLIHKSAGVYPRGADRRSHGFPVRCVSN